MEEGVLAEADLEGRLRDIRLAGVAWDGFESSDIAVDHRVYDVIDRCVTGDCERDTALAAIYDVGGEAGGRGEA